MRENESQNLNVYPNRDKIDFRRSPKTRLGLRATALPGARRMARGRIAAFLVSFKVAAMASSTCGFHGLPRPSPGMQLVLMSRRTRPSTYEVQHRPQVAGRAGQAGAVGSSTWFRTGQAIGCTRPLITTTGAVGNEGGSGGAERRQLRLREGATVRESMSEAIAFLELAGIEAGEAEAGADILLGEVTGLSRSAIQAQGATRRLLDHELQRFRGMVERRAAREPVQYIIGEWPFYNIDRLAVRPPTLIPRPETEELVELVLRSAARPPERFLEVGPGTGAISLALLTEWGGARATAVELCAHAVDLTRENAARAGLDARLAVAHAGVAEWADARRAAAAPAAPRFDLLVSNPPYIPHAQLASLDLEVTAPPPCGGSVRALPLLAPWMMRIAEHRSQPPERRAAKDRPVLLAS
jgi:release factor glutamine methyltransferase